MLERELLEAELGPGRPELTPRQRLRGAVVEVGQEHRVLERSASAVRISATASRAVVVAAAVAVAVDGEQHLRLDLREAVDDRLDAEVRRAATTRSRRCSRTRGTRRRPPRCSGGRRRRDRPGRRRARAGPAATAAVSASSRPSSSPEAAGAPRRGRARRRRRSLAGEDVLGIAQRAPGEPARCRASPGPGKRLVGAGSPHLEVLPDRGPERLELVTDHSQSSA